MLHNIDPACRVHFTAGVFGKQDLRAPAQRPAARRLELLWDRRDPTIVQLTATNWIENNPTAEQRIREIRQLEAEEEEILVYLRENAAYYMKYSSCNSLLLFSSVWCINNASYVKLGTEFESTTESWASEGGTSPSESVIRMRWKREEKDAIIWAPC